MNNQELAAKAAAWWAQKAASYTLNDHGVTPIEQAELNLWSAASVGSATRQQAEVFRSALEKRIRNTLERRRGIMFLDVDYHPDEVLRAAASEAGLQPGVFPQKTQMQIDRGEISVKAGYGCRWEKL